MAPILSKNAILVGMVDCFCLACETFLKSEEDTKLHIAKPIHVKHVEAIKYVEEFKTDGIKKIDEVSFHCLTCNMVLGLNSLTSHFTDEEHKKLYKACCNAYTKLQFHKEGKEIPDLNKPPNEQVTNMEPKLETITQKPFKNDLTCEKSQNEERQTASASEVNNQNSEEETKINKENITKTKYVSDKDDESKICNILGCTDYVTINENNKTWCILYDWVIPSSNVKKHVSEKHHQAILQLHKLRLQKKGESFEILEKCNEWQKDDIIVNSETNTMFCKKCDKYLEFAYRTIENHIMEHKKKPVMKEFKLEYFDSSNESEVKNNLHNNDDDDKNIKKQNESNDDILENVNEFQKQDINVNFESNTAFCKKCSTHIEFIYEAIRSHILQHKQKPVKKSKLKEFHSVPTKIYYSKSLFTSPVFLQHRDSNDQHDEEIENSIKNKGSNEKKDDEIGTVQICVSIKNYKEYIPNNSESNSTTDSEGLSPKIKKRSLVRVPIKVFLYNVTAVDYLMFNDVIINDKYCINFLCFIYLILMGEEFFRCHLCEECFHGDEFDSHCDQPKHAMAMFDTPVIVNDDSEFIREIHPNTFLCGFCNLVEESWESMDDHLNSSMHNECKNAGIWRKEFYQTKMESDEVDNNIVFHSFHIDEIINCFL